MKPKGHKVRSRAVRRLTVRRTKKKNPRRFRESSPPTPMQKHDLQRFRSKPENSQGAWRIRRPDGQLVGAYAAKKLAQLALLRSPWLETGPVDNPARRASHPSDFGRFYVLPYGNRFQVIRRGNGPDYDRLVSTHTTLREARAEAARLVGDPATRGEPRGNPTWRKGPPSPHREPKRYAIAKRTPLDAFTLQHLNRWVIEHVPREEMVTTRARMRRFVEENPDLLEAGWDWPQVRDHVMRQAGRP